MPAPWRFGATEAAKKQPHNSMESHGGGLVLSTTNGTSSSTSSLSSSSSIWTSVGPSRANTPDSSVHSSPRLVAAARRVRAQMVAVQPPIPEQSRQHHVASLPDHAEGHRFSAGHRPSAERMSKETPSGGFSQLGGMHQSLFRNTEAFHKCTQFLVS